MRKLSTTRRAAGVAAALRRPLLIPAGPALGASLSLIARLTALRPSSADRFARLARFAVVGVSGLGVNLLALALLLMARPGSLLVGGDALSAVIATQLAVAWNFTLTERWAFGGHGGHWLRRLVPFWVLSCVSLLAQLPLAAALQPLLADSYLLASGAAVGILMLTGGVRLIV